MKERPILFSAPMVRAILEGRKTQTRRIVKPQPVDGDVICVSRVQTASGWVVGRNRDSENAWRDINCPYGVVRDRLWVKETWRPHGVLSPWDIDVVYAVDGERRTIKDGDFGESDWTMPKAARRGNVSPLFMPRWASRITLEITGVRVERLQEISKPDAIAEGLIEWSDPPWIAGTYYGVTIADCWEDDPRRTYERLWGDINGPESWAANPWVWVIEFKKVQP